MDLWFISYGQGCGSVLISSGSGSSILWWTPIRIWIRIQSGSRALMTKNWKKITAEKKIKFFFYQTAIYLSLGLHKVCPSYRRSLQLSKEAIQHFTKHELLQIFLLLWVIFALLDPDPLTRLNPDQIRIRNPDRTVMLLMRANPLRMQGGGGWALEIETFLGSVKWHRAGRRVQFGALKYVK